MAPTAGRLWAECNDLMLVFVSEDVFNLVDHRKRLSKILDFIRAGAGKEIVDDHTSVIDEASFKFKVAASFKRKSIRPQVWTSVPITEFIVKSIYLGDLFVAALHHFVFTNPENDLEKFEKSNLGKLISNFDECCSALCEISKKLGCYIMHESYTANRPFDSYENFSEVKEGPFTLRRAIASPSGELISRNEVELNEDGSDADKISALTPARTVIANDAFAKYIVERDLGMFEEIMFYNGYEPKKEK